ncbi:hypothetical protein JW911_03220 [Candidatus Peregrinibacteria bacterium]|nr:hypothetical protein [Candidatus Peregrinibacteria bacterium]
MIRKSTAILLILIFALLTLPTLFVRAVSTTYLDPGFYEGQMLDEVYNYTSDYISEEIAKDEKVSKYYNKQEIQEFLEESFTKDNLRDISKDFISQLKALGEKRKTDAIKISLLPIKENITKMSGQIAIKIVAGIPDCTDEDAVILDAQMPECVPASVQRMELELQVKREIERNLTDVIPGEFTLDLDTGENAYDAKLTDMLSIIKYIEMILPLILLIVLLLIMLIIYKPYTTVMGFSGAALISGGVFGLVFAQLLNYLPSMIASGQEQQIVNIYSLVFGVLTQKITVYAVYMGAVGLVIVLAAIFLKKSHHNPEKV